MSDATTACAVCGVNVDGMAALAEHFVAEAGRSDVRHVMWLNRNVTKHRVAPADLAVLLQRHTESDVTGEGRVNR